MSHSFECGDNAALVAYMYGEAEAEERAAIEAHLRICSACAAELAALTSTSVQLAAWTPPEADLRFRLVSEAVPARILRPAAWWQQPLPAWAQAVAAALILAVGMSIGVALGGGGATPAPTVAQGPAAVPAPVRTASRPEVSRDDLAALERRLRVELSQVRAAAASTSRRAVAAAPAGSEAQLLARVRALIEESEQRQRRELALRTAEVVRDVDAQRQFDFARIQRAFGQFEGTAGVEIQRQRQDLNNLIRVSQRPQ